jgi:hypothetical protein
LAAAGAEILVTSADGAEPLALLPAKGGDRELQKDRIVDEVAQIDRIFAEKVGLFVFTLFFGVSLINGNLQDSLHG